MSIRRPVVPAGLLQLPLQDEQGVNFRFDYHPKPNAPDKHFHAPPEARSSDPEPSCIVATEPTVIPRVVERLRLRVLVGRFEEILSESLSFVGALGPHFLHNPLEPASISTD
ncbi:hypothetical protein [Halobellus rarus]|uniref:Uncharacterized protein n=1 Tax=Halobellus rarus TaxID=1126237 RepID=A0ABD6CPP5_9EURY|nr:hypothetical protein [Halobellus rarus]